MQPALALAPWAHGYVSEGFPSAVGEIALSKTWQGLFVGLNGGLRVRRPYQVLSVDVVPEALLKTGVG
ncbi:hypothetical protein, partial [Bacillus cereus group sp. BC327]|uniref:hypothetical protein n=1 Tax=Bacillus cereus group sp. BC327 TaxID=3445309 RepID=UPI003F2074F1